MARWVVIQVETIGKHGVWDFEMAVVDVFWFMLFQHRHGMACSWGHGGSERSCWTALPSLRRCDDGGFNPIAISKERSYHVISIHL